MSKGPVIGSRCTVCSNPQRAMADSMILAGRPAVVIARMIGCHRDAIARHKRNGHVVPVVTGSPQEPPRRTEATQAKELPLTAEELETFIKAKAGMTQGWTGSFDKLEAYVDANRSG